MSDSSRAARIGQGFSLVMQLGDPRRLGELMKRIAEAQPKTRKALESLDYVHYARFLPLWDVGRLLIVTEFDGDVKDYVMDFAAVLDDEFTLILSYMKEQPRLPVSRYPNEFWDYVERNIRPADPNLPPYPQPFSAYPDKTVIDVAGVKDRMKMQPLPPANENPPPVQLADVQANLLRSYHGKHAIHLGVRFESARGGRALMADLRDGKRGWDVTPAEPWPHPKPQHCLNIGFTYAGLQALDLPAALLQGFPRAFREGPAEREATLAAKGPSDPWHWRVGNPDKPVHAMLSVHTMSEHERHAALEVLLPLVKQHGGEIVFTERTDALDAKGTVHFGYRDGLSQPRVEGVPAAGTANPQRAAPAGDFLLGAGHVNLRGGNFIGELPAQLADNATYAAVRVMRQHEDRFQHLLAEMAKKMGRNDAQGRELAAAKLMGRWRDGSPLARWDKEPAGPEVPVAELDNFDYFPDDTTGARCPIGAHIRRLNPRNAMMMGVPLLRRVIRRGMPYGPPSDAKSDEERGLFGVFVCGDLESQFEFLLGVWANDDVATSGIRGTVDPFIGARGENAKLYPFRFRLDADASKPDIEIEAKPLVTTVGALYLFMPGLRGLDWIAQAGWNGMKAAAAPAAPFDAAAFSPPGAAFRADPYRCYAQFRLRAPVHKIAFHDSYWVFGHALVREVCAREDDFPKPGKTQAQKTAFDVAANFDDGLFFMNKPRHDEVRPKMNTAFDKAIDGADAFAEQEAQRLLDLALPNGRLDVVAAYAAPLTMRVFMHIMGIPKEHWGGVDAWVRGALAGHDRGADPGKRIQGGVVSMALRAYFHALGIGCPVAAVGAASLMNGIVEATAASKGSLHEAMQTALNFALGGYLSTEFLITTGVHNLLRHPAQLQRLRDDPKLMGGAITEMLRYDAPFQIADREVARDCELGGERLKANERIAVVYGSANRDEQVFGADAGSFDITREPSRDNFGFGHGRHICIGAPLAYTVAALAFRTLLEQCPTLQRVETGQWLADPYFRSLNKLVVSLA